MGISGEVGLEFRIREGRGNGGKGEAKSSSARTAASERPARRTLLLSSLRPRAFHQSGAFRASFLAGAVSRALWPRGGSPRPARRLLRTVPRRPRGPGRPPRGRGEGGPEGAWRGRARVGGALLSPAPAAAAAAASTRPPRGPRERGRRRLPARVPGLRWARMSGFLEELLGEKLVTGGGEEVDVHSLGARGISLLGLYFGCSLSAPCAQLSASLAAFYGRLRGDAAAGPGAGAGPGPGAGAAAEPEPRRRLEIVFVSSDQDQRQWQDFVRDMPWLALPYKEKHRKVSGAGLVGAPDLCAQPARSREPGPRRPPPAHPAALSAPSSIFARASPPVPQRPLPLPALHPRTPRLGLPRQLLGACARPHPRGKFDTPRRPGPRLASRGVESPIPHAGSLA